MIQLPSMRAAWALLALCLTLLFGASARAADEFLDPDQAFQLSVRVLDAKRLELSYKVAPGYYLYRERFKFSSPDAKLGEPQIPPGKKHYDTALEQNVETYHDGVVVVLPIVSAAKAFTLDATHQGCADKGLCYPPQPRSVSVTLKAFGADADSARIVTADATATSGIVSPVAAAPTGGTSVAPGGNANGDALRNSILGSVAPVAAPSQAATSAPVAGATPVGLDASQAAPTADTASASDDKRLASVLSGGHLLTIVSLALLLGLGLSMTPCMWPMFPILSSIIVGQGNEVTARRGLLLAVSYSLGMALVYTALGVAAALLGQGFAGFLQSPAVLICFGVLLVILSLSMFGLYELQLPSALRDRLSAKNDALSGGQLGGVFGMGVLSALIVSPCVSAPLVGALVYIGQTRDVVLGGLALFSLAVGMSVPLLVIGASAGTLLPRSGAWMDQVKHSFGLLLLAVAIYIMQPALPAIVAMAAWGLLLIVGGASLGAFESVTPGKNVGVARMVKGFGLVLALLGVLQFVGIASGGRDPAQPLARLAQAHAGAGAGEGTAAAADAGPHFDRIASVAELDQRLQAAGRPVLLDFYADWCVSCKEMEAQTFVDPAVHARLDKALLLRADVTANSEADRALLKRFHLFGPPGLIFFDAQGHELEAARVVGFQDAKRFGESLGGAGL
jgi:thiol:disulfide interchange protein DsbD